MVVRVRIVNEIEIPASRDRGRAPENRALDTRERKGAGTAAPTRQD